LKATFPVDDNRGNALKVECYIKDLKSRKMIEKSKHPTKYILI
jgi:hypothetical protein